MSTTTDEAPDHAAATRAARGMAAITALSRGFGMLRVLTIAAILGTTALGDTFQASNAVSNIVFELVAAGALAAVLVPTFVRRFTDGDHDGAEQLAGAVLTVAFVVLGGLALVGVLAAPWLARILISPDASDVEARRELATFLLRWFVPQIVLYAWGTIAAALLNAQRRLLVTSAAPIGNTIVTIAALVAFAISAGSDPGLDLSTGERYLLVLAGTGGVAAFVGIIVGGAWRAGLRLRPTAPTRVPGTGALLRHSGWGVALHAIGGLLLGAAVVIGSRVDGAVVAYQAAFVFFLAPYAIFAQPIHTAVLPDLTRHDLHDDHAGLRATANWAILRMATFTLVIGWVLAATALPLMRVFAFANARSGIALLTAGLASLAIGLYPYSAFLMLARVSYAVGDSRTPALVSLVAGVAGALVMVIGSQHAEGAALVAVLGTGHTVAYLVGTVVLARVLARRVGGPLHLLPLERIAAAGAVGLAVWGVVEVADPVGRAACIAIAGGAAVAGLGAYALAARRRGWLAPVAVGA